MERNTYRREINDRTYYVAVAEFDLLPVSAVAVRDGYSREMDTTYVKQYSWFCEDIQRFTADTLSKAVQIREERIEESERYDERLNRALDVVQEEYEEEL